MTPTFVEKIAQDRPHAGAVVQKVRGRMDESLASILILNTFAHTMGAKASAQALNVFNRNGNASSRAPYARNLVFLGNHSKNGRSNLLARVLPIQHMPSCG